MIIKGIWKTGVAAVAITLAAATFIMRADDWKRLNSTVTVTRIIPQIVFGSLDGGLTRYTTYIQIINTGSATVSVNADFYKANAGGVAGTPSTASFTKTVDSATTPFTGTLTATSLAVNRSILLTAASTGAGDVNWGSITATGNITVSAVFEIRDGVTGALHSRVGVAASPADMKQFVIPRNRSIQAGLDVGFAIVNTGTTAATASVELRDALGNSLATRNLTLEAKGHHAEFTSQFFTALTDVAGNNFHSLTFTSTSPQFAALALAIEGANLASLPVERLQ